MKEQFQKYLKANSHIRFDLKAILFDMDGVLYDSMPAHAQSWQETMEEFGLKLKNLDVFSCRNKDNDQFHDFILDYDLPLLKKNLRLLLEKKWLGRRFQIWWEYLYNI